MRLWHDLPTSVKDKDFSPFREGFIFEFRENNTLTKISEFTIIIFEPVHEILVLIAYVSSEGSD